jgi:polyhydroxyalkanoate synthesis regulator phasin
MSWKEQIKKYSRDFWRFGSIDEDEVKAKQTKRMNAERQKKSTARQYLKADVKNVTRELEDIRWDIIDLNSSIHRTSIREMEELSKALGKVSALLQKWL